MAQLSSQGSFERRVQAHEWEEVAGELLATFPESRVFALSGPLGAGKTSLVRGVVGALGGDATLVQSPTFVLERRYPLSHPAIPHISHWDWYRLTPEEVMRLRFWERVAEEPLVFVEWPERASALWKEARCPFVWVAIEEHPSAPDERRVVATARTSHDALSL